MDYKLFLSLLLIQGGLASNPCCNGENQIIKRNCADGSPLTALTCPSKYILTKEKSNHVEEDDDVLVISGLTSTSRIPPDRYCATRRNGSDIYIVCFDDADTDDRIFVVYAVLELISVAFLLLTILIYVQVPNLTDLQGVCILHSISALAISFVVLATNQLNNGTVANTLCLSMAYVTYFSMLYSFFWLNILSFHIWRMTVKPKLLDKIRRWPLIYHIFGIGGPTALLIMLIVAHSMAPSDLHPGFGETKCWFKSTKSQFIYFYDPMACLLCLNIAYYASTIAVLWRSLSNCDEKKAKILKYKLILCVKLFVIMGISWTFELLSAAYQEVHNPALQILWYITDSFNTLQGILIFLILVVFRKRVIRGMASRSILGIRWPNRWRNLADDECEEIEEEFGLSETQVPKT